MTVTSDSGDNPLLLDMKHEDIQTGIRPAPQYRPVNDAVEMEKRINAIEADLVAVAMKLQQVLDLLVAMQATQARTIERMLSLHEDPQ